MSSPDNVENNPQPDAAEAGGNEGHEHNHEDHDHSHEGHEHSHEDHDHSHEGHEHAHEDHDHSHEGHEHAHGPVLNPDCSRELILDVPAEEVSKAYASVAGEYRKHARIPGFRAGKVPESVIRRRFASEIRKEVIDSLLPERFNKAVRELGVRPVGEPRVTELTVEDGAPLHVKAVFEYLPEFSIEGYKEIVVTRPSAEVGEEEFQQEIEALRESHSTIEPVEEDRSLVEGDWAQVSYKGQIVGEPEAEPLIAEDALVEVGGKETIAAFTGALSGAKPGQQIKAEVVYPADFSGPRLAGKTIEYEIEIKGIKKRIMPEMNDEFAKEAGGYENLAELHTRIREHLISRKKHGVENETRDRLFKAYAERFTFPVPESLVQDQIDSRLDRGLRALAAQGMTPEAMRKLNFARMRAAQRDSALEEVRTAMLLDRIAAEEKIAVSDEEIDREVQIASMQTGEPLDALKVRLLQEGGLARIREQIGREKTASTLVERMPEEGAK